MPLALLLPDLTMIGYLGGTRLGAHLYNLAHTAPLPAAIVGLAWWQDEPLLLALSLVWLAHIGLDRLIGYGLKYDDHFQHTPPRRPESQPSLTCNWASLGQAGSACVLSRSTGEPEPALRGIIPSSADKTAATGCLHRQQNVERLWNQQNETQRNPEVVRVWLFWRESLLEDDPVGVACLVDAVVFLGEVICRVVVEVAVRAEGA